MAKISELESFAGLTVEPAVDLIPITDASDGKTRSIVPLQLKSSMGFDIPTIAALKLMPVNNTIDGCQVIVGGYHAIGDGGGGQFWFNSASTTPDNGGTVIAPSAGSGRWLRVINQESLNILQFGARETGDVTSAIQAAIDVSVGAFVLTIPKGTFNITTLEIPSYAKIRGAGRDTILKSTVSDTTPVITHKTGAVQTDSVELSSFTIEGTDGNGGTGLFMSSWWHACIINVHINIFRNASKTGRGIYMTDANNALCYNNSFYSCRIGNCDDALTIIGEFLPPTHSCGYNSFYNLWIDQEHNGVKILKGPSGQGGQYNKFYGFSFQGNTTGAGDIIYTNAVGNIFYDITLDMPNNAGITYLHLGAGALGNQFYFLTGWDVAKFLDESAGNNMVHNIGSFNISPGHAMTFCDEITELKTYWLARGAAQSVEFNIGNDAGYLWRFGLYGPAGDFRFFATGVDWPLIIQRTAGLPIISARPLQVNDVTQASNPDTGSIQTAGGAGIKKDLHVGGRLWVISDITAPSLNITGKSTFHDDIMVQTTGIADLGKTGERFRDLWLTGRVTCGQAIQTGLHLIIAAPTTPASATAPGALGTITWDAGFIYVCVAANTWKRAALTSW